MFLINQNDANNSPKNAIKWLSLRIAEPAINLNFLDSFSKGALYEAKHQMINGGSKQPALHRQKGGARQVTSLRIPWDSIGFHEIPWGCIGITAKARENNLSN